MPLRLADLARMVRARLFSDGVDPVTGDRITAGERASLAIQRVMRRWAFLGAIVLATAICWVWGTRNPTVLLWWNLAASLAAMLIEGVVGKFFFGQSLRDAVVIRRIAAMEEQMARMEDAHGTLLLHILAELRPPTPAKTMDDPAAPQLRQKRPTRTLRAMWPQKPPEGPRPETTSGT